MIDKDILKRAIEKWGQDIQLEMMVEECSKMIKAIQKFKRNYNKEDFAGNEVLIFNICDEIADVKIMCETLSLVFDNDLIEAREIMKMNRLIKRIKRNDKG